jgi:hypothetical protein
MLERRCADAGLPPVHPHQFRHTFAHDWLATGGPGTRSDAARGLAVAGDGRKVRRVSRGRAGPRRPPADGSRRSTLSRGCQCRRDRAAARDIRSMCACINRSARCANSCGDKTPSGSASRSNFARKPRRAGAVAASRS